MTDPTIHVGDVMPSRPPRPSRTRRPTTLVSDPTIHVGDVPDMKIKALAPWFGGKRTLAPKIIAALGRHDYYAEGCCGGLPIVLAKPPIGHEYVCDLHGDLVNLAWVVASDDLAPRLFDRLARTALCEPMVRDMDAIVRPGDYEGEGPDLERAYAFFVTSWGGRNGEAGLKKSERCRQVAMRWGPNGGGPGVRFQAAIDSLPVWWARLRAVTIMRRDWFEFCPKIQDRDGTAIYVDPPYLVKSDEYLYDFKTRAAGAADALFSADDDEPDDHERMATMLSEFRRARVVVSYYAHPRLEELYPPDRWEHIDCKRAKNLSNQDGEGAVAPEVLICNRRAT